MPLKKFAAVATDKPNAGRELRFFGSKRSNVLEIRVCSGETPPKRYNPKRLPYSYLIREKPCNEWRKDVKSAGLPGT